MMKPQQLPDDPNNRSSQYAMPSTGAPAAAGGDQQRQSPYESRLNVRLDVLAALTYLFGVFTGILFLMIETKNDYVRFHAWQSSLVFTPMLFTVSWILFAVDLLLMIWLMYNAFINGQSLTRYQFPLVGALANKWVESE